MKKKYQCFNNSVITLNCTMNRSAIPPPHTHTHTHAHARAHVFVQCHLEKKKNGRGRGDFTLICVTGNLDPAVVIEGRKLTALCYICDAGKLMLPCVLHANSREYSKLYHLYLGCFRLTFRARELCESRGGRPGLPVPNSPYGLCTVNVKQQ